MRFEPQVTTADIKGDTTTDDLDVRNSDLGLKEVVKCIIKLLRHLKINQLEKQNTKVQPGLIKYYYINERPRSKLRGIGLPITQQAAGYVSRKEINKN